STLAKIAKAFELDSYQSLLSTPEPEEPATTERPIQVTFTLSIPPERFNECIHLRVLIDLLTGLLGGEDTNPTNVTGGSTLVTVEMTKEQLTALLQIRPHLSHEARRLNMKFANLLTAHEQWDYQVVTSSIATVTVPANIDFEDSNIPIPESTNA